MNRCWSRRRTPYGRACEKQLFGKHIAKRKARIGRNPATGEEIKIKANTVVKFRLAKACKDAIM